MPVRIFETVMVVRATVMTVGVKMITPMMLVKPRPLPSLMSAVVAVIVPVMTNRFRTVPLVMATGFRTSYRY